MSTFISHFPSTSLHSNLFFSLQVSFPHSLLSIPPTSAFVSISLLHCLHFSISISLSPLIQFLILPFNLSSFSVYFCSQVSTLIFPHFLSSPKFLVPSHFSHSLFKPVLAEPTSFLPSNSPGFSFPPLNLPVSWSLSFTAIFVPPFFWSLSSPGSLRNAQAPCPSASFTLLVLLQYITSSQDLPQTLSLLSSNHETTASCKHLPLYLNKHHQSFSPSLQCPITCQNPSCTCACHPCESARLRGNGSCKCPCSNLCQHMLWARLFSGRASADTMPFRGQWRCWSCDLL